MNYEKKYKEALEKARQFSEHPLEEDSSTIVEYIFPELKESEDERTRKAVIEMIHDTPDIECEENYNVRKEDVIAWLEKQGKQKETICDKCKKEQPSHSCQDITALGRCALEKQGEQKPINDTDEEIVKAVKDTSILDMVESKFKPKFKIGDVVKMDYCLGKVVEITNDAYLLDTGQGIPFSNEYKMELLKKIEPNNPCARIYCADFNGGEGYYKLSLDNLNKKQVEAIEALVASWNKKV